MPICVICFICIMCLLSLWLRECVRHFWWIISVMFSFIMNCWWSGWCCYHRSIKDAAISAPNKFIFYFFLFFYSHFASFYVDFGAFFSFFFKRKHISACPHCFFFFWYCYEMMKPSFTCTKIQSIATTCMTTREIYLHNSNDSISSKYLLEIAIFHRFHVAMSFTHRDLPMPQLRALINKQSRQRLMLIIDVSEMHLWPHAVIQVIQGHISCHSGIEPMCGSCCTNNDQR